MTVTTQMQVREAALVYGWTWRTAPSDALQAQITKPGRGEIVVQFTASGKISSARTKHGELTGKAKRDQVLAFLRADQHAGTSADTPERA